MPGRRKFSDQAASDSWGLGPRPEQSGIYRPSKPGTCGNAATSSVLPAATSCDVPAPVMTRSPSEVWPRCLLMASVRRHEGDRSGSARAEDMPKAMKLPQAVRSAEPRTRTSAGIGSACRRGRQEETTPCPRIRQSSGSWQQEERSQRDCRIQRSIVQAVGWPGPAGVKLRAPCHDSEKRAGIRMKLDPQQAGRAPSRKQDGQAGHPVCRAGERVDRLSYAVVTNALTVRSLRQISTS